MNGKGDRPRNNSSQEFRDNYDGINWNKNVELVPSFWGKKEPLKYEDIKYGDNIPLEEWLDCVSSKGFIDYDGHGCFSTALKRSNFIVVPSDITEKKIKIPKWATHVTWFNK